MAASPVQDMALVPAAERELDLQSRLVDLASNPNFNADTLKTLVDMMERGKDRAAIEEFNRAFAQMQFDLPEIAETGEIKVNGAVRSKYSKFEDIQRILKPILHAHGFSLSFRNSFPEPKTIEVTAILRHVAGHSAENSFRCQDDSGGSMNDIQRRGSAQSYAMRYATIGLVNITTGDKSMKDDDGARSQRPEPPADYEASLNLLSKAAAKGQESFRREWNEVYKVRRDICDYILKHDKAKHEGMKAVAQSFDRAKAGK